MHTLPTGHVIINLPEPVPSVIYVDYGMLPILKFIFLSGSRGWEKVAPDNYSFLPNKPDELNSIALSVLDNVFYLVPTPLIP